MLALGSHEGKLCMCDWMYSELHHKSLKRIKKFLNAETVAGRSEITERAAALLDEYFTDGRHELGLPLCFAGTELQNRVWKELLNVPYGMTTTYSDIARRIGKLNAVRAIANAIGANPISLFVPCHRIVGSDGRLAGYRSGVEAKRLLLTLENKNFSACP